MSSIVSNIFNKKSPTDASRRRSNLLSICISVALNALVITVLFKVTFFSGRNDTDAISVEVMELEVVELEDMEIMEKLDELEPPEVEMEMSGDVADLVDDAVPEELTTMAPVDSFVSIDVAAGAASQNFSSLLNAGGSSTKFMGDEAKGKRFAFIIDYSKSMGKDQLAVMKHELYGAIKAVDESLLVTVLFFSGPVWRPDQDAIAAQDLWTNNGKGWFDFSLKKGEEGPNPKWMVPNKSNLAALERMIYTTPTTGGTDWYNPVKLALDMNPRPDMVIFMTDGATGKSSTDRTIELVRSMPRYKVRINTIALGLELEKAAPLQTLAGMTGGRFRIYTKEEISEVARKLPAPPESFSKKSLDYLEYKEVRNRMEQELEEVLVSDDDVEIELF